MYVCQQGLGLAGKDRSLRLTSPSLIPAANGLLLVGILSKGWPRHTDGEKSVQRPAQGYNTTLRVPIFYLPKKNIYIYIYMYVCISFTQKTFLNYLPNQSSFNFSLEFEFIMSLGNELDCRSGDCGSLEQVSTFKIEPEKDEIPVNGNSFYRLEMIRIQLFSSHGHPVCLMGF